MTDDQIGPTVLVLLVLIAVSQLLGHIFARMRQPRVIGEIAGGILLGPTLLGRLSPSFSASLFGGSSSVGNAIHDVLGFIYAMGLLLLMFVAGTETRRLFGREDRRQVAWLTSVGTVVPFLIALLLVPMFPMQRLVGSAGQRGALVLVLGIAVAVTSIPVISRIFHDLGIMHTRFARLVLGVAVIEDMALWAVLAIATALAKSAVVPKGEILIRILITLTYFAAGLSVVPRLLRRLSHAPWNLLATVSPLAYLVAVMFAFCGSAALLHVNLVFAAFLAGYGVARDRESFSSAIESLTRFSFAFFIPLYFFIVGFRLNLGRSYSFGMLAVFLAIACGIKLLSVGLGARMAGFRGLDVLNLAVATNARGGPGIVLASVAYDAGIINAQAFTTLVLLAILTSQAAGAWLEFVLRKGWPLLTPVAVPLTVATEPDTDLQAA
jgi:Kef-type K+ transport system membrane component KefB